MKKIVKRIFVLVLVLSLSSVTFGYYDKMMGYGYTLDELMGDKRALKDSGGFENYVTGLEHCKDGLEMLEERETTYRYMLNEFGSYPISGSGSVSKQPIEWIILDKKDGMALLISKYVLDKRPLFNLTAEEFLAQTFAGVSSSYMNSDLRRWLNNDFYNAAFSSVDKDYIVPYDVTGDKVFLLSANELKTYFEFGKKLTVEREWVGEFFLDLRDTAGRTCYPLKESRYIGDEPGKRATYFLRDDMMLTYKSKKSKPQLQVYDGLIYNSGTVLHPNNIDANLMRSGAITAYGVRPCIVIAYDSSARSARRQWWDSAAGQVIGGVVGSALDSVVPGAGLLVP